MKEECKMRRSCCHVVRIMIIITIIIIVTIQVSVDALKWQPKTDEAVYGEEVGLSCHLENECNSSKVWIGGPNYNLLCVDEYSTNALKYANIIHQEAYDFNLMIKNFDFKDLDCKYTCQCGFDTYTDELTSDLINFIYPPEVTVTSNSTTIDSKEHLMVEVHFEKVFPFPKCIIYYYQENATVGKELPQRNKTINTSHHYLFEVFIYHTFEVDNQTSRLNGKIVCEVALRKYSIIEIKGVCQETVNNDHDGTLTFVVVGLVFMVLVIVAVVVIFLVYRRNGTQRRNIKIIEHETFVLVPSRIEPCVVEKKVQEELDVNDDTEHVDKLQLGMKDNTEHEDPRVPDMTNLTEREYQGKFDLTYQTEDEIQQEELHMMNSIEKETASVNYKTRKKRKWFTTKKWRKTDKANVKTKKRKATEMDQAANH